MDKKENIEKILHRIRGILDVRTDKEMCEILDIKYGTLDTWKNRDKIPDKRLAEIARKLDANYKWLKTGVLMPSSENKLLRPTIIEPQQYRAVFNIDNVTDDINDELMNKVEEPSPKYKDKKTVSITYYPDVYASAGGGAYDDIMCQNSPIQFVPDVFTRYFISDSSRGITVIDMPDDSMEPHIGEGDMIFISPMNGEKFRDGKIYVVKYADRICVRKVRENHMTGEYRLSGENSEAVSYDLKKEECEILGRVVGYLGRV